MDKKKTGVQGNGHLALVSNNIMYEDELKENFTKDFLEKFKQDEHFKSIFFSMQLGMSPYQVIEELCEQRKEIVKAIKSTRNDC